MSVRSAPGLIRPHSTGEVTPCNYDFDTCNAGFLNLRLPYVYRSTYHPLHAKWRTRDLWETLVADPDALAVLIVNNVVLVKITAYNTVCYEHGKQPDVYTHNLQIKHVPRFQIGYVRTVPPYKDLTISPYELWVDSERRVFLHGKFISIPDALAYRDISMYRQMLQNGADHVYYSEGGVQFG